MEFKNLYSIEKQRLGVYTTYLSHTQDYTLNSGRVENEGGSRGNQDQPDLLRNRPMNSKSRGGEETDYSLCTIQICLI